MLLDVSWDSSQAPRKPQLIGVRNLRLWILLQVLLIEEGDTMCRLFFDQIEQHDDIYPELLQSKRDGFLY